MMQIKSTLKCLLIAASTATTVEAAVLPEVVVKKHIDMAGQAYTNAWQDVAAPTLSTNFVAVNQQRLALIDFAGDIERFSTKLKNNPDLVNTNSPLVSLTMEEARGLQDKAERLRTKTRQTTYPILSLLRTKSKAEEIANSSELPRGIRNKALSISTNALNSLELAKTAPTIQVNFAGPVEREWEILSNEIESKALVGFSHDKVLEKSSDVLGSLKIPAIMLLGAIVVFATLGTIASRASGGTSTRRREDRNSDPKKKSDDEPFHRVF